MKLYSIFATDLYGNIGKNGTLPWPHSAEDMAWFKSHTNGHIVIMGRKTWDDPLMPKPLPNRINVVVTSSAINMPGVVTTTFDRLPVRIEKLAAEFPDRKIFIIGGAKLLETTRDMVGEIYLTRHKMVINKADVGLHLESFFKGFSVRGAQNGENCSFLTYMRDGAQ